ncbi:hypothetical protein RUM43_003196 [Polyplax serrata]|uniref:Large ribosomal subunit protein eL14 n=1 Tax=Polyplax serrata TaxID=468196 RepID=A0AAN8S6E6_POLSC
MPEGADSLFPAGSQSHEGVVSELRDELEARNMSSKGLRLQLLARLSKILKTEQELAEQEEKNAAKVSVEKEKEKEEEEKKLKLEKEKKKTEQKNRALIEEKYALPETPHILVYPSKTAKNGKFSCKVMSLSLLLDYSTDVSKEHTFEVSLFAELFNEMLMWHFGIQVYRAILEAPDVEEKDDSEKKDEKKEKEKKQEKGKDERDDKSVEREKSGEPSDEKKVEKTEPQNLPNGNGREGSQDSSEDDDDDSLSRDSSSNRRDRRDRKRKDSIAQYTAYPELLLAFTYFDVTRYGSISKSHLEDLIHTLGLQLSRSQVKRLVGKVTYRDYCDYRKLTDLPVGTNVPEGSTSQETTTAIELGNKAHLPVFQLLPPKVDGSSPPCKRSKRLLEKESNSDKNSEGYLYYKSVLVNVDNLKEQVTRNETARLKTEEKLTELRKELDDLREKSKRSADQVRALEKELRCCKSNLAVTAEKLSEQVASSDIYLSALMDIEERLVPILDTDEIKRLIKERQSVSGAPSINLVPLTKVEDITRVSNSDDVKYEEAAYKRELMEEDVKMEPFKRFVETGRVAYISGGRYCGKLCSIVDVIDQTRVLVDGPVTGVPRIPIRLNQIRLTKYLVKFPFKGATRVVRQAWEKSDVLKNWKGGQWSSNLAKRKLRRRMSDFDRFKLRHARKARNEMRSVEYSRLLKVEKRRKEKLKKAKAKWRIGEQLKKKGITAPVKKAKKPKAPKKVTVKTTAKSKVTKVESGKPKAKAAPAVKAPVQKKVEKSTAGKPAKATTGKAQK